MAADRITVMQGDQYALVFRGTQDGEALDTDGVEEIEFVVGPMRKCWPQEVARDAEGRFLFPLTQEETFRLSSTQQRIQVRVKFYGSGTPVVIGTASQGVWIEDAMSKVVL